MLLELAAPASLPLGVVQVDGRPALLAITLQHPPVHLEAEARPRLNITGPRAHTAYEFARRFYAHHPEASGAEIEIELAIPANMGLGSDGMLALSMAQTLAWANQFLSGEASALAREVNLSPAHAGEVAGYAHGGLLLVCPTPEGARILRRAEVAHPERAAWAFVFHLPIPPEDFPGDSEAQRLEALWQAAAHLSPDTASLVETLFQAVASDDVVSFGKALLSLQACAIKALETTRPFPTLTLEEQTIGEIMQAEGAVAWGRSLTGLGLWGLIRGGDPSRTLRKRLTEHVGIFGGRVMATITDNRGAHFLEKPGRLGLIAPIHPRR
ncbi:MAG: hypothetical protein Fur0022_13750 [Anaerolineales bacterium]